LEQEKIYEKKCYDGFIEMMTQIIRKYGDRFVKDKDGIRKEENEQRG
jgi:hypothetical protein